MSLLQLLFAAVLVLGNGFFVGAEFALVSVRRSQIEPLAAAGSARARTVLTGLENLPQMMAAAQFGITVCSLTLGAVAEPTVARLLEPVFHAVRLPEPLVHPLGYAIALALVVFLHLVVGEMVPKNLAMAAPERTALRLAPALVAFARLCRPVTALFGACAHLVLRLFRVEPKDEVEAVFTSEQLSRLVADSHEAGLLAPEEQERLADALDMGSRPVTEVLLDPAALVTVGPGATAREIERLTVRTGFSRFPVRDGAGTGTGTGAGFLGYVHVKDVLDSDEPEAREARGVPAPVPGRPPGRDGTGPSVGTPAGEAPAGQSPAGDGPAGERAAGDGPAAESPAGDGDGTLRTGEALPRHALRPMPVLRAETPLDDALTAMRRSAAHLAQVADASGRVLGLVALEDVLETLVGEVHDPAHRSRRLTAQRGARVVTRRPERAPAREASVRG
ncbi:hemolysin family protein [Streptomyces albus]|uniref:hemolysin family protein n=1 Tax=Streptomyces albus TaxID=1888 RepID=UPI00099C1D5B|nr:hemolysin family protein [Streptomyces albus]